VKEGIVCHGILWLGTVVCWLEHLNVWPSDPVLPHDS
jgi:hypothetical protein